MICSWGPTNDQSALYKCLLPINNLWLRKDKLHFVFVISALELEQSPSIKSLFLHCSFSLSLSLLLAFFFFLPSLYDYILLSFQRPTVKTSFRTIHCTTNTVLCSVILFVMVTQRTEVRGLIATWVHAKQHLSNVHFVTWIQFNFTCRSFSGTITSLLC